jgi:hypothetical protein
MRVRLTRYGFMARHAVRWTKTLARFRALSRGRWQQALRGTLARLRAILDTLTGPMADILRALTDLVVRSKRWTLRVFRAAIMRAQINAWPAWAVLPEPRLPRSRRDGGHLVLAELSASTASR